jgi:hypothetical protein
MSSQGDKNMPTDMHVTAMAYSIFAILGMSCTLNVSCGKFSATGLHAIETSIAARPRVKIAVSGRSKESPAVRIKKQALRIKKTIQNLFFNDNLGDVFISFFKKFHIIDTGARFLI